jgi:hypothetical protein
MTENISDAPHGMNLVVDTEDGGIVIGRFDSSNGFQVLMHDCDLYDPASGQEPEDWVRETATYGVDVKHKDYLVDAVKIRRWRKLGDIPKVN